MAEACIKVVEEVVTTVKEVEVVQLTLSKEEAQFVLNYLGHTVTGSGLRKHSDNLCNTLCEAGITYDDDFPLNVEGGPKCNRFKGIQGGY